MRDPNRLDAFYNELAKVHKEHFPDWRFSQFIINFLAWYRGDPFYLEEGRFLEQVHKYVREITSGG